MKRIKLAGLALVVGLTLSGAGTSLAQTAAAHSSQIWGSVQTETGQHRQHLQEGCGCLGAKVQSEWTRSGRCRGQGGAPPLRGPHGGCVRGEICR